MDEDIVSKRHPNLPIRLKDFINKLLWGYQKAIADEAVGSDYQMYAGYIRELLGDAHLGDELGTFVWLDTPDWLKKNNPLPFTVRDRQLDEGWLYAFYRFPTGAEATGGGFGNLWPLIYAFWDGEEWLTFFDGQEVGDELREEEIWMEGPEYMRHRDFIRAKIGEVPKDSILWQRDFADGKKTSAVAFVASIPLDSFHLITSHLLNWSETDLEGFISLIRSI